MPHYQQIEDPQGLYRRADGTRVTLARVENIRTPQGYNVGWQSFETSEAAIAAWGLEYLPEQDL